MINMVTMEVYIDSSTTGCGIWIPKLNLGHHSMYEERVTVNYGEFRAMQLALEIVKQSLGTASEVIIFSDSQIVVCGLTGKFRIKAPGLKQISQDCMSLYAALVPRGVMIHWIPREKNEMADWLSQGMKGECPIDTHFVINRL